MTKTLSSLKTDEKEAYKSDGIVKHLNKHKEKASLFGRWVSDWVELESSIVAERSIVQNLSGKSLIFIILNHQYYVE